MNINGLAGIHRSQNENAQVLIIHVAHLIERQLKEWEADFQVYLTKLSDYELTVHYGKQSYSFYISEDQIDVLKTADPYALDKIIWQSLRNQGLPFYKGTYLDAVL